MDEVPVLMVSSPVNKYYLLDLGPKTSVIAALQGQAQSFVSSWVNPDQRHRDIGLDGYVQAVLDMLETVREITGSPRVHVLALCAGGLVALAAAGYLAATGRQDELASLGLGIVVADYGDDEMFTSLLDAKMAAAIADHAFRHGYYDAADTAAGFAWIRPEDGVWMNVVNNYLLGRRPRASELLSWAADYTHLTARLGRDLTDLQLNNSFATPAPSRSSACPWICARSRPTPTCSGRRPTTSCRAALLPHPQPARRPHAVRPGHWRPREGGGRAAGNPAAVLPDRRLHRGRPGRVAERLHRAAGQLVGRLVQLAHRAGPGD